jgi:Raf kinase inhibitor-like YbhB/YbcL family protein
MEVIMPFELKIHGFQHGEFIPKRHTCDGEDVSPQMEWSGQPAATKSFALIMDDPDAPAGTWNHWLLWDIPAHSREIPERYHPRSAGRDGTNDFGRLGYGGPCPPRGHGQHRYRFKLFALDVDTLDIQAGAKRTDLDRALQPHVLAQTGYMGRYERR